MKLKKIMDTTEKSDFNKAIEIARNMDYERRCFKRRAPESSRLKPWDEWRFNHRKFPAIRCIMNI